MYCRNINKTYNLGKSNEVRALKNISLEFEEMGITFILGKSGSGKSTLLNILAMLDRPTQGELYDCDIRIDALKQEELDRYRKNNIGFIFQDYCLIPELSVAENIALGDIEKEIDKSKIEQLLERLDLKGIYNTKVTDLSGGQQQRVSIARALYKESKIVFADEPTGNLDKQNARIIFECLRDISKKCLIVVVSHDREFAEEFGDRIIELDDGEVVTDRKKNVNNTAKEKTMFKKIGIDSKKKRKINYKLIRKISSRFSGQRKVKKLLSMLLMILVLLFLGVTSALYNFDFAKLSESILKNSANTQSIGICRGYINSISNEFCFGPRPIEQKEIEEFNTVYTNNKDYYYRILGAIISNGDTGSKFLFNSVSTAVVSNSENLKMYNFRLDMGSYPEKEREIAITDYLAYSIYLLDSQKVLDVVGLNSKDELKDDTIVKRILDEMDKDKKQAIFGNMSESYDDMIKIIRDNPGLLLLSESVDFYIDTYTITGIITTGYEQYEDMLFMSDEKLLNDERTNEFVYLSQLYYYNFYVADDFLEHLYSNGAIVFDSGISVKYSEFEEELGLTDELQDDEIYMSSSAFREYFEEDFDSDRVGTYKIRIESSTTYEKGGPIDIYYDGGEVKVVGVFDLSNNYLETFGTDNIIVFSDSFFNEYSKHQISCWMIQMFVESNDFDYEGLVNYLDAKGWYYYNYLAADMYNLTAIMHIFSNIFLIAFVVIMLFSIIIIVNYFSGLVVDKKKEIGIMRTLGISSAVIKRIFINIALKIMFQVMLGAIVLFTFGVKLINDILSDSYLSYIRNTNVEDLYILNYSYHSYMFMILICFMILLVAIFVPLRKIARINPIEAIRK